MYDIFLILHFIGLAIGLGSGIAISVVGLLVGRLPEDVANSVMATIRPVSFLPPIGLVLLIISGVGLLPVWHGMLVDGKAALFYGKMACVVVILVFVGALHRQVAVSRRAGTAPPKEKLALYGNGASLFGLIAVVLAVVLFK